MITQTTTQKNATTAVHTAFGRIFTARRPIVILGKPSIIQRQILGSALVAVDSMRMTTGTAAKPAITPVIAVVNLPRSPQTSC